MKWQTVTEACEILGIKPASLYAYASRGLVRARASDIDPRSSLYSAADIDALLHRKRAGRARNAIAQGAMGWGEPVLDSAITTVQNGRLIYRGHDAVTLSDTYSLEEVASLLWGEVGLPDAPPVQSLRISTDPKTCGFKFLAASAARALPAQANASARLRTEASALLVGLSSALSLGEDEGLAHEKLAKRWSLNQPQADILRRALVLLADHELNPSTFSARIAASTGASLAACCLAGYATLTGPFHGEAAAKALDFLHAAHRIGPKAAVVATLERGDVVAGIGHKLYPDGDPRARALFQAMSLSPLLQDAIMEAEKAWSAPANIDMALSVLTLQLGLPTSAPFTLFATARMAGWLAHAHEQIQSGQMIRPRARYRA